MFVRLIKAKNNTGYDLSQILHSYRDFSLFLKFEILLFLPLQLNKRDINRKGGVIVLYNKFLLVVLVFAIIFSVAAIILSKFFPKIKFLVYSMTTLLAYMGIYLILHLQV